MSKKITKAVTFSYDDGVKQDTRLSELFNKYHLKCTFNIPSDLHFPESTWVEEKSGVSVEHLNVECAGDTYVGHEIAGHTCNHPWLNKISDEAVLDEILRDREQLTRMYKTKIYGMAYPFGTYDERCLKVLRENNFLYARTTKSNHSFDLQKNLLEFEPTCHHNDDRLFSLAESFIALKPAEPKLFYVWGHSYEFDVDGNWDRMEEFCKLISGRDDIFYGTNIDCFKMFYSL